MSSSSPSQLPSKQTVPLTYGEGGPEIGSATINPDGSVDYEIDTTTQEGARFVERNIRPVSIDRLSIYAGKVQ